MKHGYKVLQNGHSCIIGLGGFYYEKGLATKPHPNNGPLCVFNTKADAKRFVRNCMMNLPFTISRCKYEPSKEAVVWLDIGGYNSWRSLKSLPAGTQLAASVTILE